MSGITLTTINARYVHAALGLRYLRANMGALREQTRISEFVLGDRPADIAERLLADAPRIIGFGVYIWNVEETARVIAILKRVAPTGDGGGRRPRSQLRNGRAARLRAGRLRGHRLGRRDLSADCAPTSSPARAGAENPCRRTAAAGRDRAAVR